MAVDSGDESGGGLHRSLSCFEVGVEGDVMVTAHPSVHDVTIDITVLGLDQSLFDEMLAISRNDAAMLAPANTPGQQQATCGA